MNSIAALKDNDLNITEPAQIKKGSREIGIEILRIIAMFLIVSQHFINHGGFMKNAEGYTVFLNLINVLFSPAINIFVIITGYFSINSKFKIKKCATLWLQVLFYSVSMLIVAAYLGASISNEQVYLSLTPVINKRYWFFSAYILLYIISPFIATMLNNITEKQFRYLFLGIFLCSYISTRFPIKSIFSFSEGYTVIWFIAMFIVGAYLRKYPPKIKKLPLLLLYVSTMALLFLFKYHFKDTSMFINRLIFNSTDYDQPLVLISAILLFLLFVGIKNNGKNFHKAISFISSTTFGIYLFHEAPIFKKLLYNTIFKTQEFWGRADSVLYVLLFALLTFLIGCAIESLRIGIFNFIKYLFSYFFKKRR